MKCATWSLVIFALISLSFAQPTSNNQAYISLDAGTTIPARDGFKDVYSSNVCFSYGGGFGFPISSRFSIASKVTYFRKNGMPILNAYQFDTTGQLMLTGHSKVGTASYWQWFLDFSLQYHYPISPDFTLYSFAGVSVTKFNEDQAYTKREQLHLSGAGFLGYFIGLGLEKKIIQSPVSIFIETQYYFTSRDHLHFVGYPELIKDFGASNIHFGVRYRFGRF